MSGTASTQDRIGRAFARCREEGSGALVTYLMAGDPDLETSKAMALACVEGGADILELGVPFSDPIAEGVTIQRAAERSLKAGTTVKRCLALAASVREKTDVPIAFMGYLNPMLAYGDALFGDCRAAGVDALIIPDLPPDEAVEHSARSAEAGIQTVFLLAPTSTPERIEAVCRATTGFVYFVSVTGVTGARAELPPEVGAQVRRIRAVSPRPVVVGFGVSRPEQAKVLKADADGVVVGSAIVSRIAEGGTVAERAERVRTFVASLKAALHP
ncbi:MAG TPA: tryptophan synthase subunit alpha [Myxococcaceae bacterium]|nr:tryptophan synthase subunit alpha [Myxococcaceae bacterium]